MPVQYVLLPLFAEVLLTFGLMLGMMYFRTSSLRRGGQFAYAFSNQFELPVLFYLLTVLSLITHHADLVYLVLAWIFVAMRVLQAFVHVTNNNVPRRGAFYGIGALVLLAMWLVFIVRILAGLP